MERFTKIFILFSIFLIIAVSMTGCSDNPDTTPSDTVAATTTEGPLYTAGDVVRSATGSESPAWLVVSYDPAADSYARALIYKNTDGSYGYRTSPNTELSKRTAMEKVFTVKITTVTVGSVPTGCCSQNLVKPSNSPSVAHSCHHRGLILSSSSIILATFASRC